MYRYIIHTESAVIVWLFSFQYMPHYDSEHSEYALMIRDRPPTTYFWQRNPTKLKVITTSHLSLEIHNVHYFVSGVSPVHVFLYSHVSIYGLVFH